MGVLPRGIGLLAVGPLRGRIPAKGLRRTRRLTLIRQLFRQRTVLRLRCERWLAWLLTIRLPRRIQRLAFLPLCAQRWRLPAPLCAVPPAHAMPPGWVRVPSRRPVFRRRLKAHDSLPGAALAPRSPTQGTH